MDVRVGNCLSSRSTIVHANVEAVGMKFRLELLPDTAHQLPQASLFGFRELVDALDVTQWNYERMALRNRETIGDSNGMFRSADNPLCWN